MPFMRTKAGFLQLGQDPKLRQRLDVPAVAGSEGKDLRLSRQASEEELAALAG